MLAQRIRPAVIICLCSAASYGLLACDGPHLLSLSQPDTITAGSTSGGSDSDRPAGGNSEGGTAVGGTPQGGMTSGGAINAGSSGSDGITPDAGLRPDAAGESDAAMPDGMVEDDATVDPGFMLLGAPMVFAPTLDSFGINVVLASGDPSALRAYARAEGEATWRAARVPVSPALDTAEWVFEDLEPGTRYQYELVVLEDSDERLLYAGEATTQREAGESFTFALISDSHIGPRLEYTNQGDETILAAVSEAVGTASPEFVVNLGDMLDFHEYGFNAAPPSGDITRLAYLNYRKTLGDTLGRAAHFGVIGNWEGENGDHTAEQIAYSREQRLLYMPNPKPETYPEGGSRNQDYYAFTWGDALFVALNVMTYTPTPHLLSLDPGVPDDWTLGEEQLQFLKETLENATSKWRFLLIHHAVGGAAGDEINAAYGRGGGQAAYIGEQAIVHQLMLDHGVQIFFYGHDHVFTDIVVDDIHYTLPGSAGAIWKFTTQQTGYAEYWPDSGYGLVHVSPDAVDVEFVTITGDVIYEYRLE